VLPVSEGGAVIEAGEDGDAIAYGMLGSIEAEPAGNTNYSQALSVRDPAAGWSSRDIATPHEQATGVSIGDGQEYRSFSSDLSLGLVEQLGPPAVAASLSPGASEKTVYLRADEPLSPGTLEQGAFGEAVAEGGYKALATSKPGYENVPPGTKVSGSVEFMGATPNLSHVVLYSRVPLTTKTPEGNTTTGSGLYEWSAGQLQLISLLPNHEQASSGNAILGYKDADARGAVSSDGSRVIWSNGQRSEEHLYMRDVASEPEQTLQLDAPHGGSGPTYEENFQFANSDGSKVFFTDATKLLEKSTTAEGESDLYECEIAEAAGELSCELRDLTIDSGGHADVQGVVLAGSNDSSYVYFVANGILTRVANSEGEEASLGHCNPNNAQPGATCNLYMLHYDEETKEWEAPVFIARLANEDERDWEGLRGNLEKVTSRVSPNGRYLAFMSERELTGYDNMDTNSGAADEEVFLYDAGSNRLVCASCNPTGERPVGVLDSVEANAGTGLLIDEQGLWDGGRWLAANIPGWTGFRLGTASYQSRYLSDEGRLFFNSPDALVAQATNGLADVYEYEPAGVGGCEASSATFSERSEGCVGLISSGSSGEESVFLDASTSGEDVFFLSSAQLAPADTGSASAVYDAHVCSAASPCPTEAVSPPPCGTEASCKAAPSPQPPIFGASGSATFSGAGNPAPSSMPEPTPKGARCAKGKKLEHGKCVKTRTRTRTRAKAKRAGKDRRAGR
jgi:hypothetical protein